jgi:hypothetical protein
VAQARVRLSSLRDVANLSARSTIAAHVRRRYWENAVLKLVLIVQSGLTALAMWNNGLFGASPNIAIGWAAAAIGAVAGVELVGSTFKIRETSPFRKKKSNGKANSRPSR